MTDRPMVGVVTLDRNGLDAAARALCAADYFRIQEPAKSAYIEQQWASYLSRAEAAVLAYVFQPKKASDPNDE